MTRSVTFPSGVHLAEFPEFPRTVGERLDRNAHLLRFRQVQVGQRRLARELDVAAPETAFFLDESGCAARQFSDRM
jgi:hypothetical protein